VPFKHIACAKFFVLMHHKHAARQQSGKFCVAYPPDEKSAARIMAELVAALPDEEGPYVLTDRRYGGSRVVHYRYGAYAERSRVRIDGSHESLLRDANGRVVPDIRGVRFQLPEGITDPFGGPAESTRSGRSPSFAGYSFDRVIQHSNAGGAYQARDSSSGRVVFIKESREHNGLVSPASTSRDRLRCEYRTLRALHAACPGICPAPISYFTHWEHEFLVTEFVPGISLWQWCVAHNPIIWSTAEAADFHAYYRRCRHILDELSSTLRRMHDLGYVFVDLNPRNVLIGDDDSARLIDFEVAARTAELTTPIGVPGYYPTTDQVGDDKVRYDEYGLSSLALSMIAPLNTTADRNPVVLTHLRHQLDPQRLIPDSLWTLASRFRGAAGSGAAATPTPAELDADPVGQLTRLRDRLITGLLEHDHPDGRVPLGPQSYATNALCVAHGLAGVVHALTSAGAPAPKLLERLRRESLAGCGQLPPGLDVGLAGIAWVLADHGLIQEALALLAAADAHPLLAGSATLEHGKAGVGLAHLALFGHTGDEFHLDRAASLADSIPRDRDLNEQLGRHNATGLSAGRAGLALLDFYLAEIAGQGGRLASGLRLLAAELDRAAPAEGGLLFPASDKDTRLMPYLYCGTAGVGMVASRFLAATGDERLTLTMPGLLSGASGKFSYYGGLYAGMAGLGLFLDDHARRHRDEATAAQARLVAKRMFLYTVPHREGSWVMGEHSLRMSGDLWCGSAGVLLFLTQFLEGRADCLFTLDHLSSAYARDIN
jgi:hypothetical protein